MLEGYEGEVCARLTIVLPSRLSYSLRLIKVAKNVIRP